MKKQKTSKETPKPKTRKVRRLPTDRPLHSAVELVSIGLWLSWELEVARKQRNVWAMAHRTARNEQTIASYRFWSDAVTTLEASLRRAQAALQDGVAKGTLPDAPHDVTDVLSRN